MKKKIQGGKMNLFRPRLKAFNFRCMKRYLTFTNNLARLKGKLRKKVKTHAEATCQKVRFT